MFVRRISKVQRATHRDLAYLMISCLSSRDNSPLRLEKRSHRMTNFIPAGTWRKEVDRKSKLYSKEHKTALIFTGSWPSSGKDSLTYAWTFLMNMHGLPALSHKYACRCIQNVWYGCMDKDTHPQPLHEVPAWLCSTVEQGWPLGSARSGRLIPQPCHWRGQSCDQHTHGCLSLGWRSLQWGEIPVEFST